MSLGLAFRAFFAVLSRRESAERVRAALAPTAAKPQDTLPAPAKSAEKPITTPAKPAESPPKRSEALTLLSALQREARLLDLVCESLDQYNDAQIGAAARDVLRDTRKTLDRMFGLRHLVESPEGESVEIPSNPSPTRWRIVGKESSKSGTLSHPGWQATKVDMPQWAGGADDSMVIAAAEVET